MIDVLQIVHTMGVNTAGCVAFALLAVIIGTRHAEVGWRDYLLIIIGACLAAGAVAENWLQNAAFVLSCLIGFCIGYLADDVLMALNAALPDFVREILRDVSQGIKAKIKKWFG